MAGESLHNVSTRARTLRPATARPETSGSRAVAAPGRSTPESTMMAIVFCLVCFGVVMVYSAKS
jgi:hypothetical protein